MPSYMGHSYKKIKDSGRVVFDFLDTKGVRGICPIGTNLTRFGYAPYKPIFSSFRSGEVGEIGACEGTQAVLAITSRKRFLPFRALEKKRNFFEESPHRGDITLSTINTRNSGERG